MMNSNVGLESVKSNSLFPVESQKLIENQSTIITKGQKNLKQQQDDIQMCIENRNIEKHVKELIQKFDSPPCINCPKRRADRVCTNKECGPVKYMQIICGKCHADVHEKALKKPEIDLEEYFVKLATFMNEQNYLKDSKVQSSIKIDDLNLALNDFNKLREQLTSIKKKITKDVEGYQSPQQMHALLQGSITKAMSLCEFQSIQEQLQEIKQIVLFEKNSFLWNDASQKYRQYIKSLKQMKDQLDIANMTISKSFIGGNPINLNNLKMIYCPGSSIVDENNSAFKSKTSNLEPENGVFKINSSLFDEIQYNLDYELDWNKKYKLRIKFTQTPKDYVMIGIMPLSLVNSERVYNMENEYFCKRFFNDLAEQECSRIIKGADLDYFPIEGTQIDMRIDMENHYMDFADYPDYHHINANHTHFKLQTKGPYVITIAIYQDQQVTVELFEEISSITPY